MTSTKATGSSKPKPTKRTVECSSRTSQRPPAFRRVSDSTSIISDIFRHPDVGEDRIQDKIQKDNEKNPPQDLVDFLRNTTPPPENYMSIPETYSLSSCPSEQENWARLNLFGWRRKSSRRRKPRPMLIKLPDSAVAGTTTDGHRYIAISIPTEYDHPELRANNESGDRPGTSPPLREAAEDPRPPPKTAEPRTGLPKTLTSDRGVVTVLRPVVEDRESSENLMRVQRSGQPRSRAAAMTPPVSPTSPSPGPATSRPRQGEVAGAPAPPSTRKSIFQHQKQKSSSSSSASGFLTPYMTPSPRRRSSVGIGPPPSSRRGSVDSAMIPRHRRDTSLESNMATRASIAESVLTNGSEPVIVDATTAQRYVPLAASEADTNKEPSITNPDTVVFAPVAELPKESSPTAPGSNDNKNRDDDDNDEADTNSVTSAPEGPLERQISHYRRSTGAGPLMNILPIRTSQDDHQKKKKTKKEKPTTPPPPPSPPPRLRPSPARRPTLVSEADAPPTAWQQQAERSRRASVLSDYLQLSPVRLVADTEPLSTTAVPVPTEPPPPLDRTPSRSQRRRRPLHVEEEEKAEREHDFEMRLARLERRSAGGGGGSGSGDAWLGAIIPLLENIDRSLARMSEAGAGWSLPAPAPRGGPGDGGGWGNGGGVGGGDPQP